MVNVNPLYTPRELEHQLNDSGAAAIVIVSNFAHTTEKVVDKTQVKHVILTRMGDQLSAAKGTTVNFVVKYIKRLVPKYHLPDAISFRARCMPVIVCSTLNLTLSVQIWLSCSTPVAPPAWQGNAHPPQYAGEPRAGECDLRAAAASWERVCRDGAAVPHFALTMNCLLFIELGGQNLLITNPRDIPGLVKELAKYPFTAMTGVNTLFNALLNNKEFQQLDFSLCIFPPAAECRCSRWWPSAGLSSPASICSRAMA